MNQQNPAPLEQQQLAALEERFQWSKGQLENGSQRTVQLPSKRYNMLPITRNNQLFGLALIMGQQQILYRQQAFLGQLIDSMLLLPIFNRYMAFIYRCIKKERNLRHHRHILLLYPPQTHLVLRYQVLPIRRMQMHRRPVCIAIIIQGICTGF